MRTSGCLFMSWLVVVMVPSWGPSRTSAETATKILVSNRHFTAATVLAFVPPQTTGTSTAPPVIFDPSWITPPLLLLLPPTPSPPTPPMLAAPPDVPLPIGAQYHRVMRFPVIGRQMFRLQILSETKARLQISGMLSIDEVIAYTADWQGRLSFSLSAGTKQILQRFRTKLLDAGYDARTDTPYVRVAPYILPAVTISMGRVAAEITS